MALRFPPLDTPRFALTGADVPDSAAPAMTIPQGDATDPRPDLSQAVLERRVSQDGGGPCVRHSWAGPTAATTIVQERAAARLATWPHSPTPRDVGADSQRYHDDQAAHLRALGFRTRMPHTLPRVCQGITPARPWDPWQWLPDTRRSQRVA